ncbi:glycosyltransferase family 2 protein [Agriterribacter sp.]|uniref:glycosyltransferase family 2 protein n=1 Tax=Agriterribacter sp. TaxID=2821509 RepID=UPI002C35B07F|nr:glycosyltransferase family 2 protein [Agriterribacter sp.]HRO44573.1 glycosyltransferase family 2 protein [Agriterribacter sp.]HRQ16010.1 glycosyltransferase family 2 protein [Agriterribacter sp.]
MSKHAVSVIIPCYNSAKWIGAAVESCIDQGSCIKEIIIVDDHSTDNSWDILTSLKEKHGSVIIEQNPLKGANNARNYGFSLSSGNFIQWLDSDDFLLPGKLDAQLLFMEKNPSVDIAYSDWRLDIYDENKKLFKTEYKQCTVYKDFLYELLTDNWIASHAYLLRRDTVQQVVNMSGWNPLTSVAQDREFFTKAALAGATFGYIKGSFAVYNRRLKMGSVSRSMSDEDKARNIIQLLNDFIEVLQLQSWISETNKKKYKEILTTQILYYASIYDIRGLNNNFSFKNTDWRLIKGYRSKLKMLKRLIVNK